MLNEYQVWMEGYEATGDYSPATLLGIEYGETFNEAALKIAVRLFPPKVLGSGDNIRIRFDVEYAARTIGKDEKNVYVWGCRLYNNEDDARAFVG